MLQLAQIMEAVNRFAPWELAEAWDQVGLEVNRCDAAVQRIMIALDLNSAVLSEGQRHQVDGFIVHHPVLFKPLRRINPGDPQGQILAGLIKHNQFVIAAHTNMDKAERGINHYLAELLGLTRVTSLEPATLPGFKVVVFTPPTHERQLREAMAAAGAGVIGAYRECSFAANGTGTFRPGSGSHPYLGQPEQFEAIPEVRLEMLVESSGLDKVLQAVYREHPYEEPVVDVYSLMNQSRHGLGRIGELTKAVPLQVVWQLVKERLRVETLKTSGAPEKPIVKIAVCSGSGGSLLHQALRQKADLYLTGELDYHKHWEAREHGLAVIEAGHGATESCFVSLLAEYLEDTFNGEALQIIRSGSAGEPFQLV